MARAWFWLALLALLAFLFASPFAGTTLAAPEDVDEAEMEEEDEGEEAEEESFDPESAAASFEAAEVHREAGRLDAAADAFWEAIEADRRHYEAHVRYQAVTLAQGKVVRDTLDHVRAGRYLAVLQPADVAGGGVQLQGQRFLAGVVHLAPESEQPGERGGWESLGHSGILPQMWPPLQSLGHTGIQ